MSLARSSSAAQRRILATHASRFSPRDVFDRLAGRSQSVDRGASFTASCAPGVLPLLADIYEYVCVEPMDGKPRRDLQLTTSAAPGDFTVGTGPQHLTLRCWTAVLPWELSYGLSRCDPALLGASGSVSSHPSGMIFLQRFGQQLPSFWSGAIRGPLDVAFASATAGSGGRGGAAKDANFPALVSNVERLDPFVTEDASLLAVPMDQLPEEGSRVHSVKSTARGTTCVLETAAGVLDPLRAAGASRWWVHASPDMLVELDEKYELLRTTVAPLCESLQAILNAMLTRTRKLELQGSPMHDDDVLFVAFCLRLGMQTDSLFDLMDEKLAADVNAAVQQRGVATVADDAEAPSTAALSETALQILSDLSSDASVGAPPSLRDALETLNASAAGGDQ